MEDINGKEFVQFDREKLKKLKKAYKQAVKDGKETFMFEGHQMLVLFVRYLIEYLEGELK